MKYVWDIQKNPLFLCISNVQLETSFFNCIIYNSSPRNEIISITHKKKKDLHTENYESPRNDIEEAPDGETFEVHERDAVKMSLLPQLMYRFNTISIKTPAGLFVNKDEMILKCIRKGKGKIGQNSFEKEESW